MRNKQAKQMIEDTTPPPANDAYWPFNEFPWSPDYMCQIPIKVMQRDSRIIRKLKKRLDPDFMEFISDCLYDCEYNGEFDVVRYKEGSQEGEAYCVETNNGALWIDEHENGGFCGDSYSGYGYIKISAKDYLKFSYSM
jgi:hypothetical protein